MAHAGPSLFREPLTGLRQAAATGLLILLTAGVVLLALFSSASAQSDCRTIDDFAKAKVGELPPDWKLRKDTANGAYRVTSICKNFRPGFTFLFGANQKLRKLRILFRP